MLDFPTPLAGTTTIVALVGLGIFIYPWLLGRKGGAGAVGAVTVLLIWLFYTFDASREVAISTSLLLALLWALAPVGVGALVYRLRRPAAD